MYSYISDGNEAYLYRIGGSQYFKVDWRYFLFYSSQTYVENMLGNGAMTPEILKYLLKYWAYYYHIPFLFSLLINTHLFVLCVKKNINITGDPLQHNYVRFVLWLIEHKGVMVICGRCFNGRC